VSVIQSAVDENRDITIRSRKRRAKTRRARAKLDLDGLTPRRRGGDPLYGRSASARFHFTLYTRGPALHLPRPGMPGCRKDRFGCRMPRPAQRRSGLRPPAGRGSRRIGSRSSRAAQQSPARHSPHGHRPMHSPQTETPTRQRTGRTAPEWLKVKAQRWLAGAQSLRCFNAHSSIIQDSRRSAEIARRYSSVRGGIVFTYNT
jgi:hypothetical protein